MVIFYNIVISEIQVSRATYRHRAECYETAIHFKLLKQHLFMMLCVKFHPTGKGGGACLVFLVSYFFQAEFLGPEKWKC